MDGESSRMGRTPRGVTLPNQSSIFLINFSIITFQQEGEIVPMKITNIETYPVWGGSRNYLFVVVDTDEGIYGVGEAGITGRELAVAGAIEHFKPLLIGQDPGRIEHIWQV